VLDKHKYQRESFNTSYITELQTEEKWKPPKYHSFETMQLVHTDLRSYPAGFGRNGRRRRFNK